MLRKLLYSIFLFSFLSSNVSAQKDTLTSPFTVGNGSAIVTFNFKNTNAYPVIISEIGSVSSSTATLTVEGWYSTTPLAGTFVAPTVPNGWVQFGSGTVSPGAANVVRPFFPTATSTMNAITVAPGATIAFNIGATSIRYANTTGGPLVTTKAGCEFIAGTGIGFGGTNASVIADRGFVGYLVFEPAGPCQNPPTVPTIGTNSTTVCSGVNFTLSLSGGSGGTGQTYQWDSSPDGSTWSPIFGANSPSYTGMQSDTTSYRCIVSCGVSVTTLPITLYTDATPLNGVYTLNSALATSGTNFQSFATFAQKISCNGVSGPVTLNVVVGSGPYTEQVSFGTITGISSTNTLTINGNGETLQFAPTLSDRHIVKLDGTDYITIDGLKIKGTDPTYGWGVFITNSADYVTIQNCTVDLGVITSTNSLYSGGIVVSGSTTSMTTIGNNANVCRILNNTIKGGATGGPYYGITMCGNTNGLGGISCEIKGNTIQDFYIYGLYCNQTQNILVENNEFTRPTFNTTSSPYPMYFTGGQVAGKVNANQIHNLFDGNPNGTNTSYGIYVANGGAFGQNMLVSNNIIYNLNNSGAVYAMYVTSAKNIDILHNSIAIDNAAATGTSLARGMYLLGTNDSISIKNNIVSLTRGGTGTFHGIYSSTVPATWEENNNNIYVNSPTSTNNHFGYFSSANRTTLSDWQTITSQGASDQEVLPIFANAATGDLKPSAASLNNVGMDVLSLVPNDYLGVARTTTPDIGAFEFTPITDDAGATLITTATCAGAQNVFVKVRNFGLVTLDSVVVSATMNGTPTSLSGTNFKISVASGADTTLDLGTLTFVANTSYNGVAFTNLPNGSIDANKSNDTATLSNFSLGLNGVYTVNSATITGGTNFQTFTDLADALNNRGVCGPVIVNTVVGSGPYNEQVLLGDVQGVSAVNTITINGNGETLTFLSSVTAQRAGFALNGTDYVTIDSFNIVAQGSTTSQYGYGVHLIGQANNNTIKNNTIMVDSTTTSSNYAGIAISGSTTSAATAGANGNYNTIENNTIVGGYYGISSYGQSSTIHTVGNSFLKNKIYGFYYYGLTAYYQDSVKMEDNSVTQRSASTICYGIYPYYSNDISVVRNKLVMHGTGSNYGIYPYYINVNGTHNGRSLVANNFVTSTNLSTTSTIYGIAPYNNIDMDVFHNSINILGGSATAGRGMYFYATSVGTNVRVMNNIIVNEGPGYGVEVTSSASTGYIQRMDNNNIYTPNGTIGRFVTTNYATLADWTTASQLDSNSFSVIPLFNSPTDLHIVSNVLNNKGAVGLGVDDDIDGDVRCPLVGCAGSTLRPDIGADEFLGAPITVDLGVDELVSPTQKACFTATETVSVKIHNYNNTTIYFNQDPATLKVSVAGANPITFPNVMLNTDSLMSDSTKVITLPGTYDMSALGMYDFTVVISQVDDVIKYNDTLHLTLENTIGEVANSYAQICSGSPFELKMNGTPTGASVQWQLYNPTTMMWVDEAAVGSDSVAYMVAPTAYSIYRAKVCGIHFSGSDTLDPIVVTPPTAMNDTVCLGESSQLIASSLPGNTHQWYASSSSTTPIFVGDTLNRTFTMDTTLYIDASQTLVGGSGLLKITKIDIGGADGIEIQNLSNQAINTTGWTVALSNSYTDINSVNANLWTLPASMPSGQMDYKTDASGSNYWGSNILWNPGAYPTFTGWAMILDNTGKIVDAIFLNWPAANIAAMNTTVNGFPITITNEWVGDGVSKVGIPTGTFIARIGNSDNDDLNDFNLQTTPYLTQNVGLTIPFIGGSCTSTRVPVSVKVNANPVVNLGTDTAICAGASVTLDAANAGATFLWNDASTMQTLSATTANTYSVAVTDANGCVAIDTLVLTVNANPVVNLGADTAICAGASVTLDAGNAGSTFAWTPTATTQTVSATIANDYSVVVTDANGCKGMDTVVVSVNASPVVSLGADTAICAGASVTLDAGNAGSTFAWTPAASTQTVSATMANDYSVVVTDANGCTGTDTVMVSVNANPVVSLGADTAICAGASVTLDAGNAGSSYAWTPAASTQTVSATMANDYSVVVTDANGCIGRDTLVVTINALPVVTISSSVDTACQNSGAISLTGTPAGGVFSGTGVTGSSFSPATVGNQPVSYAVTNANGCSNTATKTIVVKLCIGIENTSEIAATVYPVPMNSELFVELPALSKSTTISLYGADGRMVMTRTIDATSATKERIEVANFASGIYTVRVVSGSQIFSSRLIKE